MSTDCEGTKWRRNIAENFSRLSTVHERYRRQTDRRQTDGRQQIAKVAKTVESVANVFSFLANLFLLT